MGTAYKVRPGETLRGIAAKHGFQSYRDIYLHPENSAFRMKRPNPDVIMPGDVLIIPNSGPPTSNSQPTAAASETISAQVKRPKLVAQDKDVTASGNWTDCWAASLESWMAVVAAAHPSKGQIIEMFNICPNAPFKSFISCMQKDATTLRGDHFAHVADHINVKMAFRTLAKLEAADVVARLPTGPLYLAYGATAGIGHVVVVWGIRTAASGTVLDIMDPWMPAYTTVPLSDPRFQSPLILGWRWKPFAGLKGEGYW